VNPELVHPCGGLVVRLAARPARLS
jgi:hypothetical protein